MATQNPITLSQSKFLLAGGIYELPMQMLREKGILAESYVFQEYPKVLNDVPGAPIANSEDEEDRIRAGQPTDADMEEEKLALQAQCRHAGILFDAKWPVRRLRRELGEKEPEADPIDKMGALEAELATLRKMEAMQAEIDALKAKLTPQTEDLEALRSDLTALGVKVDGRWSASRLREELERATASQAA